MIVSEEYNCENIQNICELYLKNFRGNVYADSVAESSKIPIKIPNNIKKLHIEVGTGAYINIIAPEQLQIFIIYMRSDTKIRIDFTRCSALHSIQILNAKYAPNCIFYMPPNLPEIYISGCFVDYLHVFRNMKRLKSVDRLRVHDTHAPENININILETLKLCGIVCFKVLE